MSNIIPGAEAAARRTAAAAALADYRKDEARTGGPAMPWAMWAGRLAAALDSVLAAPVPAAQDSAEARKLAAIRSIFAGFDWEFHDRQLALEAIERIVLGEEAGR